MQDLDSTLHAKSLVSDVMEKWPQTIEIFVRLRMACPGCPIARFHTLAEVAAEYQVEPGDLMTALQECIGNPESANAD